MIAKRQKNLPTTFVISIGHVCPVLFSDRYKFETLPGQRFGVQFGCQIPPLGRIGQYDWGVEITSVNPLKRPTIRDVAAVAGVSKSLVSLAFREPSRVADARLKTILAAAEKLGYVPNMSAQSLSSHTASFVGVVVVDLSNPLQTDLADRVRSELAARDVFALMTTAAPRNRHADYANQVRRTLSAIRDLRPRGLIVVGTLPDMDALMQVSASSRVCVVSAIPSTGEPVHVVRVDDAAGIRLAWDDLLARKATSVTFVGGLGGSVSNRRQTEFILRSATNPAIAIQVVQADYGFDAGRSAAEQMIASGAVPDGVIAHNDMTACGIQAGFVEAGRTPPHIIGFDNTAFSAFPQLALSSIDQHNDQIAAEAVRWLESEEAPGEVLVQPTLIRRAN